MAQPFDYLVPFRPADADQRAAGRIEADFRRELAERAALAYRLGRSKEETLTRLRARVAWEFEKTPPAPDLGVAEIVEGVWSRAGMLPHAPLSVG